MSTFQTTEAIAAKLAAEVRAAIDEQAARGSAPLLIAIDGRCGSGKTTLATALSEQLGFCPIAHTDDFYLPFDRRAAGWQKTPCANMDFDRLAEEVLEPMSRGEGFLYRPYSCAAGTLLEGREIAPAPVYIIEGSYSQFPRLAEYYRLKVFLTCSPEVQRQRLQPREGANFQAFLEKWIPLEEGYFRRYDIEARADSVFSTDTPAP